MKTSDWYKNWFDTKYYHILYKERNDLEAEQFINSLIDYLAPQPDSKFLDLACGKGRHSVCLSKKGFQVTGIDLSLNSIRHAHKFATDRLNFIQHDMREFLFESHFDYIFNLFTSFGYFEKIEDDRAVIKMIKHGLKPGGKLVLDYFNGSKNHPNFNKPFSKTIETIHFDIHKTIEDGRIFKHIKVTDGPKVMQFEEQVRIYTFSQFKQLIESEGLMVEESFGNYSLEPFDEKTSERLILMVSK